MTYEDLTVRIKEKKYIDQKF